MQAKHTLSLITFQEGYTLTEKIQPEAELEGKRQVACCIEIGGVGTQSFLKLKKREILAGKSKSRLCLNDLVTVEGTSTYLTSQENNWFRYFLGCCMSLLSGHITARKARRRARVGGGPVKDALGKEALAVQAFLPHTLPSEFPGVRLRAQKDAQHTISTL